MALPVMLAGLIPGLINKGFELFDKKYVSEGEKEEAVRNHVKDVQKQIQDIWDKEQAHIT